MRVGDTSAEPVDIRVVAATNRDLEDEIKAGRFREDLYYRLNVVNLHLPPLRERGDDIVVLARYLLAATRTSTAARCTGFTPNALARDPQVQLAGQHPPAREPHQEGGRAVRQGAARPRGPRTCRPRTCRRSCRSPRRRRSSSASTSSRCSSATTATAPRPRAISASIRARSSATSRRAKAARMSRSAMEIMTAADIRVRPARPRCGSKAASGRASPLARLLLRSARELCLLSGCPAHVRVHHPGRPGIPRPATATRTRRRIIISAVRPWTALPHERHLHVSPLRTSTSATRLFVRWLGDYPPFIRPCLGRKRTTEIGRRRPARPTGQLEVRLSSASRRQSPHKVTAIVSDRPSWLIRIGPSPGPKGSYPGVTWRWDMIARNWSCHDARRARSP